MTPLSRNHLTALLALAFSIAVPSADAAVKIWSSSSPTGTWSTSGQWNGGTIPVLNDTVVITSPDALTHNISFDVSSITLGGLTINSTAGAVTLSQSANLLTVNGIENIGNGGSGFFTQTGGTHSVSVSFNLGVNAADTGTYSLSGTGILNGAFEYVGNGGTGNFTQNNGDNSASNLYLGYLAGASGTYSLSGGVMTAALEFVGFSGTGSFTQTGGSSTISGLILGNSSQASGSYALSGGTLTTNFVSVNSASTFTWSSGTLNLTSPGGLIPSAANIGANITLPAGKSLQITNTLSLPIGTSVTVNGGSVTVGALSLTGGHLLINNGGTLIVQPTGADHALIQWPAGAVTVSTGRINLADHDMILTGAAANAVLFNAAMVAPIQITNTANNKPLWVTTAVMDGLTYKNLSNKNLFDAVNFAAGDLLFRYGLAGDITGSGQINLDDYLAIDQGYAEGLTGYANGDFNHDGVVNAADFALIDLNYRDQGNATLADGMITHHIAEFGDAYTTAFDALLAPQAVPEPASLALLTVGAIALLQRRRAKALAPAR